MENEPRLYRRLRRVGNIVIGMSEVYFYDTVFEKIETLAKGEYECCTFVECDFSKQDFSDFVFIDCSFRECNLSLVNIHKSVIRDVEFSGCKMMGLRFEQCNEFGLSFTFTGCQLNHSSFYKLKIKNTVFNNSQLQEVDFTEADLSGCTFNQCDFLSATFYQTILEKSDFRNSFNYSLDPELNRIKKARFSTSGISGLLDKYDIQIED